MNEILTDSNLFVYAAKSYDNPRCVDTLEFVDDLNRATSIKKLVNRYKQKGDLKERLILNHLIVFYNVFHHEAATKILALKLEESLEVVKPFLILLNYWPDKIEGIVNEGYEIKSSDVPLDPVVVEAVRKIRYNVDH